MESLKAFSTLPARSFMFFKECFLFNVFVIYRSPLWIISCDFRGENGVIQ